MNNHPLYERLDSAVRFLPGAEIGMVVLRHHVPEPAWSPLTDGYTRWECVGHFGSNEEQHEWPCDEVRELAEVLGVAL